MTTASGSSILRYPYGVYAWVAFLLCASGALLGHVVEIDGEEMTLVSADPIAVDRYYDVRMVLPGPAGQAEEVHLRVQARSHGADASADFHDTRFRLEHPDEALVERIRDLIGELRFPGPAGAVELRHGPPGAA